MPYLAVAIGGLLGAVARYLISEWVGTLHGFPVATLIINIAGSAFLSWFYTLTLERLPVHPHLRLCIGTGFVGAFTTFSTLTVDVWNLTAAQLYGWAGLYLLLTFAGGLLAAAFGYWVASRQAALRWVPTRPDDEEM
ncbi:fluoride efflux transporter CrcB [Alicyclobacillus macrosporangiidus]|uniref:Fluoride-specific ion channel FluC n=1 Tax=Alicyclobacillus macrosporangiidus TaxID=392015 RepID=A0A1I7K9R6_9BACL|nr:fluoride efflux transporter CrcB [Alicyclobacillus macrosporangiidus]SFU94148.1 CrcB protein [Alicyclobacillus macrosporangiidus]